MSSKNFLNLADHLARGAINFGTDTFKLLLVSVLPDETEHDTWVNRSEVADEVSGAGYTAGGVVVTATIGALDTTNNRLPITFTDLAPGWAASTLSAVGGIVYKSTGNAATDKLVCSVDFTGTVTSSNGNFSVDFTQPIYINV